MKRKKRDRAWFEQKVHELGKAMRRLPDERQGELFKKLDEKESPHEPGREAGREGQEG